MEARAGALARGGREPSVRSLQLALTPGVSRTCRAGWGPSGRGGVPVRRPPWDLGEDTLASSRGREREERGEGGGGEVEQGEKKLGGQGGLGMGNQPPPRQSQPEWSADEREVAVAGQRPEAPPLPFPLCSLSSVFSSPSPGEGLREAAPQRGPGSQSLPGAPHGDRPGPGRPEWPLRGRAGVGGGGGRGGPGLLRVRAAQGSANRSEAAVPRGQGRRLTKCRRANRPALPSRNPGVDSAPAELAEGPRHGPCSPGPPPPHRC